MANIKKTVVPSMFHLQFVQYGYVHGGFVPALSDCEELDNLSTVIKKNDHSIKTCSSVLHIVFGIGLERPVQYKKQSFVIKRGKEDGKQVLLVERVLLLFHLSKTGNCDIE